MQIYYIDYGHEEWVHWETVRHIPDDLKVYDQVAIHCRLDGLYPTLPNNQWTFESAKFLGALLQEGNRIFRVLVDKFDEYFVNLVKIQIENPLPEYTDPIDVNRRMFEWKYASIEYPRFGKFTDHSVEKVKFTLNKKYCYTFVTFITIRHLFKYFHLTTIYRDTRASILDPCIQGIFVKKV